VPEALEHFRGFSSHDQPLLARGRAISRSPLTLGFLLVALALGVYARTVCFGFVIFDDPRYITENFYVLSGLSLRGIRWAVATFHDSNWIPLTWLSLMLDTTLYGGWAGGFHATNVCLHVANVLLVFVCFMWATGNTLRSGLIAALFAVHPMHVESVAWITERKDVLSMFFGLLSLCAYVRSARRQRDAWLVPAFAFFALSLAAKQTFVTLPFVFLLLDFWPLRRLGGARPVEQGNPMPSDRASRPTRLLLEKVPFFALSAASCWVALLAQSNGHAVRPLSEMSTTVRILNSILAYGLYLEKAIFPHHLAVFYPHPGASIALTGVIFAGTVLISITLFAIENARRWPFVLVGWFWFLGTLVPMLGLVQVGLQQMADRYAYFPYLGLYLALAWLVPATLPLPRRALPALASVVVLVYAAIAFRQVGYWRDGITLMRRDLAVTGDNSMGRTVLADAFFADSRIDEALAQYRRNIELAPRDPQTRVSLGVAFYNLKNFPAAAAEFREALKLDEHCDAAHTGLALALCGQRRFVEAKREFLRALEIEPDNGGAHAGLAVLAHAVGNIEQSIDSARRALARDDSGLHSQRLLAITLFDEGRLDEAIDHWRQIVALSPGNEELRAELDQALVLKRDQSDAVRQ
jgi:protein O-mannosyl-transferase